MKYTSPFLLMCVVWGVLLFGQDRPPSAEPPTESSKLNTSGQDVSKPKPATTDGPLDVLSDTGGVDIHPYLNRLLLLIKAAWYRNIPEVARAPIMKKGKVTISFRMMKDGNVEDVHYVETSGDPHSIKRLTRVLLAQVDCYPCRADLHANTSFFGSTSSTIPTKASLSLIRRNKMPYFLALRPKFTWSGRSE